MSEARQKIRSTIENAIAGVADSELLGGSILLDQGEDIVLIQPGGSVWLISVQDARFSVASPSRPGGE